jgi:hypothetical protein
MKDAKGISFMQRNAFAIFAASLLGLANAGAFAQSDPLPSWNDGAAKKAITDFVARVTTPGDAGIVHHTDEVRKYAYDRQSKTGKLDEAWDDAIKGGWTVVDMKDWKTVFPKN